MPAATSRWYDSVITVAICGYDVPRITTRKPDRGIIANAKESTLTKDKNALGFIYHVVTVNIWDIPSHGSIGAPGGHRGYHPIQMVRNCAKIK